MPFGSAGDALRAHDGYRVRGDVHAVRHDPHLRTTGRLDLPGFAKKVLSPKQRVTQTDVWSGPDSTGRRTGTFVVEAKGTPVQVHGTLVLTPRKTVGCTNTTDATVECKVPLIGAKIADLVANDTRRALDHELAWMSEYLTR